MTVLFRMRRVLGLACWAAALGMVPGVVKRLEPGPLTFGVGLILAVVGGLVWGWRDEPSPRYEDAGDDDIPTAMREQARAPPVAFDRPGDGRKPKTTDVSSG